MVNNKDSTRYYSDRHERRTAKSLNAKVQTSSGSSAFLKGDVVSNHCLIECKTSRTEKKSVSIKKEWLDKIEEQCFEMGKQFPIVAFDFGDGENYYVINEMTMRQLIEWLDRD